MKITVTQQDIDSGYRLSSCSGPLSLAFARLHIEAEVNNNDFYGAYAIIVEAKYYLPDICLDFIWRFDNDMPVKPFSFELDIPEIKSEPSGS